MPLEPSVVNIADLNPAWPLGADPASISDDNHRNIKTALLNAFAGFTGSVMVAGVDGGTINAYTLTPARPVPALSRKMLTIFAPVADCSGPSTLNISGLGATPIVSVDGAPLAPFDLQFGYFYVAVFDGTQLRLTSITKRYTDNLAFGATFPPPPNDGKQYVLSGRNGSAAYAQTPVGATIQAYKLGAL